MTVDRLPTGMPEAPESDRSGGRLETSTILSMCDRILGEVGRRAHMFGWLRAPGAGTDQWLAVDAYYPRSRVVVMCRPSPAPHEAIYRERIPAHGLGLLTLDPAALGDDPAAVEAALAAKISDGHKPAPRPASRPARPSPSSDAGQEWTSVKVRRTPVAPAVQQGLGVLAGLVLTLALVAEIFLAVVVVGLQAGRPLLGLAIALDSGSRGLGTVAAERAGTRGWASACAVGGSPVVAWFALSSRADGAEVEPAPLAGLLALLAGGLALLALLIGI
jgi:hypothetical protein